MLFESLLYKENTEFANTTSREMPRFMIDLNIDQIIDEIIAGREEYELRPIFYDRMLNRSCILYRQQIMRDIENEVLYSSLIDFSINMRNMRTVLKTSINCRYGYQKERLFLDSVYAYCSTVKSLHEKMKNLTFSSEGFQNFYVFLSDYISSKEFVTYYKEIEGILSDMGNVRYDLKVEGLTIRVLPFQSQPDYNKETRSRFSKFLDDHNKDYLEKFPVTAQMNDIEALILKGVATLYPQLFDKIILFFDKYQNFQHVKVEKFDREIQFYLSFFEYYRKIEIAGSPFCYPEITTEQDEIFANDTFDIALASQFEKEHKKPVANDFLLSGHERIMIISGPNQGGKTTFARTFGQLHYFGGLGLPVAGTRAKILLSDHIFTHFEKSENIHLQESKLEHDLNRIHEILDSASARSIIILNEIFSSTTLRDSKFLSSKLMEHIEDIGAYCIWVTFIDELASMNKAAIHMSAVIDSNSANAERTYKVIRKIPDGQAYALSLAKKYRLSYDQLIKRIAT